MVGRQARLVTRRVGTEGTATVHMHLGPTVQCQVQFGAADSALVETWTAHGMRRSGVSREHVNMVGAPETGGQRRIQRRLATMITVNVLTQSARGFAGRRRGLARWFATVKYNVNGGSGIWHYKRRLRTRER